MSASTAHAELDRAMRSPTAHTRHRRSVAAPPIILLISSIHFFGTEMPSATSFKPGGEYELGFRTLVVTNCTYTRCNIPTP